MIPLIRERWAEARPLAGEGRAGLLFAPHLVRTGRGDWWVDRWPAPTAMVLFVGGNLAIAGDAQRIGREFLAGAVTELLREWDRVFIDVPDALHNALGPLQPWPLIAATAAAARGPIAPTSGAEVRRLAGTDLPALSGLDASLHWIGDTWGGLRALAESGRAWSAWVQGELAALSAPGFVGDTIEDVFVVTEPAFRGRGLSPACAGQVLREVAEAGHRASWTTWPANRASLRVAEKLGFSGWREHQTWIAGEGL